MAAMEDPKKRKLERTGTGDGVLARQSDEQLRLLLDPLRKDQLVDLLVKLGTQIPEVAEEIRGVASADPVHRKLFVRGLSWETTSETLFSAFSTHGDIEEGAVITDKATGKSRGYGFITYRHMESAQRALQEPSKLIDGRNITVKLADSHKSKVIQTQAPMSMAPLALPYQHGFAQQGKSHAVSPDPVGYASYTHGLPSYPTAYGNAPSGFANQPQTSYMGLKKDQPGLPSTTTGVTGYSFYAAKP
ncbi:RNA recognition motif domain-containing protein [Dioscorea alata]|uniref:RNA recognition motif domain-containing protein n=2 Tax=Dioscorea alata TaxID=55571 RepID=A0ACB7UJ11_DIOAL|nr:RNA recognition motif domain-containing protein [Dioscorea alata]KAH7660350.1 RNA recognition motif domain-containing protein [Dioscorea alata]